MTATLKSAALAAGFAVLIAGSLGCFTAMTVASGSSGPRVVATDTVFAAGRPDAELAERLGERDAVAFLGEKNTYMLVQGGSALLQIATELDGQRILLLNPSNTLFMKDRSVWGTLSLLYRPGADRRYSDGETATLRKLGFTMNPNGAYQANVAVKGVVYPAVALPEQQMQRFAHKRTLTFYDPSGPAPDFGKIILVPIAIAADAATLPVQVAGFAVLVLMVGVTSH